MVGLGQEDVAWGWGRGDCIKYLKRGLNRKEGKGNKKFQKRGASWIKGWVPWKRERPGIPLWTMVILTLIGTFHLRTIKIENNKNITLRLRLGKIIFLVIYLKARCCESRNRDFKNKQTSRGVLVWKLKNINQYASW